MTNMMTGDEIIEALMMEDDDECLSFLMSRGLTRERADEIGEFVRSHPIFLDEGEINEISRIHPKKQLRSVDLLEAR